MKTGNTGILKKNPWSFSKSGTGLMLALFAGVRTVYSKKYNKFFGYSYTNFIHSFYQQALN